MALSVAPNLRNIDLSARSGEAETSPISRLLVLVPAEAGPDAELAAQAWRLAAPEGLPVVLVGLAQDSAAEAQRRRQLASLAALTRGEGVAVTTRLALAPNWLAAVRRLWAPGDLLICFAGQAEAGGWLGLRRQPLATALRAALGAPLVEAELSSPLPQPRAAPLSQTAALLAALFVVAGFFLLQAQIVQVAEALAEVALLALSVAFEFLLIRVISNW